MISNFEQLVPGLAELRAQERDNRALCFLGLTHTVCGVQVKPLTPMHRLGLQLLRNAFTSASTMPLDGDVFQFLWFLSPGWHPPSRGWRLASEFKQWRLRRHVRALYLQAAIREIQIYLVSQLQDLPESGASEGKDQSPWLHWIAADATFWLNIHGGFTLEEYLNTPYLVLQQLYRGWQCNHPTVRHGDDGKVQVDEPDFTNASDRLVRQFIRQHQEAATQRIRNQRERRN